MLDVDLDSATIRTLAGTSLDELMRWLVPLGLFVPVTPGTRSVTVGGAIAADIHGKNHHVKGSWCNHVESFRLIDGAGEVRDVSPASDPELFWATDGGDGPHRGGHRRHGAHEADRLRASWSSTPTGPATSTRSWRSWWRATPTTTTPSPGSTCWPPGRTWVARSSTEAGSRPASEALAGGSQDPYRYTPHQLLSPPDLFPPGLLNPLTLRAFNELWYRKAPARRRDHLMSIEAFFHPLDMIADWNRIYGRRGFLQWQFVVPDAATEVVRRTIEELSAAGVSSFLAVLKRFGPGNEGHLSFPTSGWTLALDIPVVTGLDRLLDRLDDLVVEAGGRIYLAKDSTCSRRAGADDVPATRRVARDP